MPTEPEKTAEIAEQVQLAQDAEKLLERARELGVADALPDDFTASANALITLDTPKTTNIAKALGLDADSGEAHILSAITQLRALPDVKVLEAHAAGHGMVLLTAERAAELEAKASAGEEATHNLHEQRFAIAFDKAQFEGRVDALPETRQLHRAIFDANPDLALRNLAAMPQVVNVVTGDVIKKEQIEDAPGGFDQDRYTLHQRAEAYMAEHPDIDYLTAAERVMQEA